MRISDWRSDVCSSDLPEQLERQRAIIAEVERLRQRERLGIPGHRARVGEGACLGIDQRRGEQMLDRKSVVSGKSVAVRVDLGGRRIIKTNTQRETESKEKVKDNRAS